MISKFLIFIVSVLPVCAVSCTKNKDKNSDEDARSLFNKSALLISEFNEKINLAADSIEADSLNQIFEKRITELNFSFPPLTDLKLTEQENDSLYKLLGDLKTSLETQFKKFSSQPTDSIISDEISPKTL